VDSFEKICSFLMREIERAYASVEGDRGGETVWGISRANHPGWEGWSLVDGMRARGGNVAVLVAKSDDLEEMALAYYETEFWNRYEVFRIPNGGIAAAYFDSLMNHSPRAAGRLLQRPLGVKVDGVIGPKTLDAIWKADPAVYLPRYFAQRAVFYRDLAAQPSQAPFYEGWMWRLFRVQQFINQTYK